MAAVRDQVFIVGCSLLKMSIFHILNICKIGNKDKHPQHPLVANCSKKKKFRICKQLHKKTMSTSVQQWDADTLDTVD